MHKVAYRLVDVFTDRPFGGNPLAVVPDARGLSSEVMQAITREFNLSETSFVFPPEDPANTYKVRIFTPGREMLMAGHPTVGTGFVVAREGMVRANGAETNIRFEEGVGPIPVRITYVGGKPDLIWMTQPLPTFGPRFEDRAAIATLLGLNESDLDESLPLEVVSTGVPFLYVPVRTLEAARRVRLRLDLWEPTFAGSPTSDVFIFTREVENRGSTIHSRMFAPDLSVMEDPATGAASGPLGAYLVRYGLVSREASDRIVSEQGIEMGRPSFVRIEIDTQGEEITGVRIGGRCRFVAEGQLELESLEHVSP